VGALSAGTDSSSELSPAPPGHEGNRQLLNAPLDRVTESAFGFSQQPFTDSFMRRRAELWVGAVYRISRH
jgi:hypothetical protein